MLFAYLAYEIQRKSDWQTNNNDKYGVHVGIIIGVIYDSGHKRLL